MSLSSTTVIPNPWARILDALEKKVNRHSYDTWLKPTRYSHASNKVLFVRVPTAEFRQVGDKYADLIQEALDNLNLGYEDVKFVTAEDDPSNTPIRHNGGLSAPSFNANASGNSIGVSTPSAGPQPVPSLHSAQGRFDWDSAAQLNPRYTFDAL
jgi:chromosomal replication initiator protein